MALARLPRMPGARVPDCPRPRPVRDLWPGDTGRGARLMKGELVFAARSPAGAAAGRRRPGATRPCRRCCAPHAHGFTWLRDLRALGTDAARLRARALVSDWMARPPPTRCAHAPTWRRAGSPPGSAHYDFFAATADDAFRQRLMARLVADARTLAAACRPRSTTPGR